MSMEIELARFTTRLPSRVRCSVFWSPFSPWQFFADGLQRKQPRITRHGGQAAD